MNYNPPRGIMIAYAECTENIVGNVGNSILLLHFRCCLSECYVSLQILFNRESDTAA